uniref:NADH-ubiquinone oxidoreductase chain 4 n=1 Tax=Limnoria quadripunctata TaxID=161573 RepID=A0A023IWU0_LIMQU|nr:NADH dehydrogenase subunit 4 [Limnoria quadripunctata]
MEMMKLLMGVVLMLFMSNLCLVVSWISLFLVYLILVTKHEEDFFFSSGLMIWDSLSVNMIILTLWIMLMVMLSKSFNLFSLPFESSSLMIKLLTIILVIAFSMSKFLYFYIMFEVTLFPTFVLIVGWGTQPERLQAGNYLLMYTIFFSLPLLISILVLFYSNSSDVMSFANKASDGLFGWSPFFLLAFLVKLPTYSIHLWLPKAHVEAPVEGSMILAGILLKLGGYGMIRVMPLIKVSMNLGKWLLLTWVLVGGVYAGMMCMIQMDIKVLIALSSVAHMALVSGGIFSMNKWGVAGGLLLMLAHGFSASGMFCMNNMMYERLMSRSLFLFKGVSSFTSLFILSWFIVIMSNMAAPPSLNLLSEMMLLISIQAVSLWYMIPLGISIFVSASYSFFLYGITSHGKSSSLCVSFSSLSVKEGLTCFLHLVPIVFMIFILQSNLI